MTLSSFSFVILINEIIKGEVSMDKNKERMKKELPEAVVRKLESMDELNQESFWSEFQRKRKSPALGWWIGWTTGLHYAYIGKWWLTMIFWMTCGGFMLWWFRDLFLIPKMVREYNKSVAVTVLKDTVALM